jgi:hypothetical protein
VRPVADGLRFALHICFEQPHTLSFPSFVLHLLGFTWSLQFKWERAPHHAEPTTPIRCVVRGAGQEAPARACLNLALRPYFLALP